MAVRINHRWRAARAGQRARPATARQIGFDPAGVHGQFVIAGEVGVLHHRAVKGQHGGHAFDGEFGQRRGARSMAAWRVGPHTISLASRESNWPATKEPAATPLSTRTPAAGRVEARDAPGRGQKAAAHVLGVDAELEGVAVRGGHVAGIEPRALGHAELLAHQVEAGGFLGHRVLDLQAGVDLQEGDRAALAEQKLDRAGADVAGGAADVDGGLVDACALRR
jgi:hypothetical protein